MMSQISIPLPLIVSNLFNVLNASFTIDIFNLNQETEFISFPFFLRLSVVLKIRVTP